MHIVHVIKDLDRLSGGPSRSVPALCEAISRSGNVSVSLVYGVSPDAVEKSECSAVNYLPAQSLLQHFRSLHLKQPVSFIHIHGLWTPGLAKIGRLALRRKIPYCISPRGMLSDWCLNHKRLRKRLAMYAYQHALLRKAAFVHATSQAEADDIRRVVPDNEIVVAANGCDLPPRRLASPSSGERLAVSIARIHPVKQLDRLISAWARLKPKGWRLRIAGPADQDYGERLRKQIESAGVQDCIELIGAVDDAAKWELLAKAELFILPSASENFGMAVAEALASSTPVITTTGTPWREVEEVGCGGIYDGTESGLTVMLRRFLSLEAAELSQMGEKGRALVASRYSWDSIGSRMVRAYGSR